MNAQHAMSLLAMAAVCYAACPAVGQELTLFKTPAASTATSGGGIVFVKRHDSTAHGQTAPGTRDLTVIIAKSLVVTNVLRDVVLVFKDAIMCERASVGTNKVDRQSVALARELTKSYPMRRKVLVHGKLIEMGALGREIGRGGTE